MPWKSDAQRRWGHTKAGMKALGGKKKVEEWDEASRGKELPEKKMDKKSGGSKKKKKGGGKRGRKK